MQAVDMLPHDKNSKVLTRCNSGGISSPCFVDIFINGLWLVLGMNDSYIRKWYLHFGLEHDFREHAILESNVQVRYLKNN